jgi:capsular exopolysaccharide synthesis family protein
MSAENSTNEAAPAATNAAAALDLHGFLRTIYRRRWIVLPFFVTAVLVTTVVTLRATKIYDATCTIIIDLAAPRVLEKEQVQEVVDSGAGAAWYSREYYETQYRVLTSRAVAQRTSDRLQLGMNPKFLRITAITEGPQREAARAARDPVAIIQANLKVEPVKDSRIVRIRYEDPDPELASIIANTVAEAYIAETLSVRSTTTASAADWLEQQLADLERKLDASGKALFEFKKAHDIVAASWEDRQGIVSQRLTAINAALTNARLKKAELEARNEAIEALGTDVKAGVDTESLNPVVSNVTIQALKSKYLEVRQECADLHQRYLDDHPRLAECEKRLALAKQGLDDQVRIAIEGARKEYKEINVTARNLVALLNETKAEAFGLNQYERDYLELKRTHDNNQRLYELVLKRLKDTGVTGMLQVSNVRILDRARPSTVPVRPSTPRNLALAVFLGLFGGIAMAFAIEYLDRTVTTQDQVEQQLGLTFLGIVPSVERSADGKAQDLFVHSAPKSAVSECLRAIRTNLLFMSPDRPLKTILVTSSGPQEGKTTTATSLAITMAGSGSRVLLVDADMRRPRIHKVFGISSGSGLSSLILGEGHLSEAVRETEVPGLYALPCGPVPPNPAELLHTDAFRRLLGEMSDRYDRVIIDSPPVGVVADSAVISTHVNGTVVVIKAGRTAREAGRKAVRQLRDLNANILGAVLNDINLQRFGQYAYYYQYGYYYGESRREPEARGASVDAS